MTAVSGHLQVVERADGRRYYALWRDEHGRHKQLLGPAWVKPHGRTARGAIRWRAADGPKPSPEHLTPADAEALLRHIITEAERASGQPATPVVSFGAACAEWLRYTEHDRQRRASTIADYRNILRGELLPAFGAETVLSEITTEVIDAYRERRLDEGRLSRRTLQKNLVVLHGILKRAKRKGWVARNAAADAERVTVKSTGDFNVLTPAEVHAVARAAADPTIGALLLVAGFTGLRMSELLALRWRDVDFGNRSLFVRAAVTRGREGLPKSGKVRSVPLVDQALVELDRLSQRPIARGPECHVFCNAVGHRLYDDLVRAAFYEALDAVDLGHLRRRPKPIVFHDLRHTFGTLAVQVFPLSDVQAYMGHQDISTTMIYVHHVPRHDAADRLSDALRRSTQTPTESRLMPALTSR
jgi:integrase